MKRLILAPLLLYLGLPVNEIKAANSAHTFCMEEANSFSGSAHFHDIYTKCLENASENESLSLYAENDDLLKDARDLVNEIKILPYGTEVEKRNIRRNFDDIMEITRLVLDDETRPDKRELAHLYRKTAYLESMHLSQGYKHEQALYEFKRAINESKTPSSDRQSSGYKQLLEWNGLIDLGDPLIEDSYTTKYSKCRYQLNQNWPNLTISSNRHSMAEPGQICTDFALRFKYGAIPHAKKALNDVLYNRGLINSPQPQSSYQTKQPKPKKSVPTNRRGNGFVGKLIRGLAGAGGNQQSYPGPAQEQFQRQTQKYLNDRHEYNQRRNQQFIQQYQPGYKPHPQQNYRPFRSPGLYQPY